MLNFKVDKDLCTKCGLCAADCVAHIISEDSEGYPVVPDEENCLRCQHCMAVCPTAAISIFEKDPLESVQLTENSFPEFGKVVDLVKGRRSVRQYRDENVDKELLYQILDTLSYTPTGVNAMGLQLHVIDDKDVMERFKEKVLDLFYEAAARGQFDNPRIDAFARQPREELKANMFRRAPHALVISEDSQCPCPREDVALALAYFELLAQSAGLGTVWWGYFAFIASIIPEVKTMLGIPEGHVFYAMLFGVPNVKYARTVQKDNADSIHRIVI